MKKPKLLNILPTVPFTFSTWLIVLSIILFCVVSIHVEYRHSLNLPPDMDSLATKLRGAGLTVVVISSTACCVSDGPHQLMVRGPEALEARPERMLRWKGLVYIQKMRGDSEAMQVGPWSIYGDPDIILLVAKKLSH